MTTHRHAEHPIAPFFFERWSPRAFTGEAIDEPTLWTLFEAARWAPSAFNAQPWRFIYGRRGTPAFQTLFDGLLPSNQAWAGQASALVAVVSARQVTAPGKAQPQDNHSHSFDAGAAWAHLALQAQLLGWHTHGMGGFDRDKLRASLGVPEGYAFEAVVAIGRMGDKSTLPEALQAREVPSSRRPAGQSAAEGRFDFEGA
ncbi:nitroreductase family protein [Aquincola sp. MAHUQ-54]|uniref:Nitroreductase family protein n=1 Tax=Aquincola agrisoli TaxID=3119538 RepID=A0AAW9Q3G7_9BURK